MGLGLLVHAAGVAVGAVWKIDRWSDIRGSLIAAAAAVGVPFLVWRTVLTARQTRIAQETHYTDLFTKAVEQLGAVKQVKVTKDGKVEEFTAPNIEVRMGAIYALERISRESDRDYGPIIEVLSAYVRENSNDALRRPRMPDVMAAITVLARRRMKKGAAWPVLDGANLRGADLNNLDLSWISLVGADLADSSLKDAFLRDTILTDSCLDKADLSYADLGEANFMGASLKGADFMAANLCGAIFHYANLMGAKGLVSVLVDANDPESEPEIQLNMLDDAQGNEATILPQGVERPAHWSD